MNDFSENQEAVIARLTAAFQKSKSAGVPLQAFSGGAGVVFPSPEQSTAIAAVGRAVKAASKLRLEVRIAEHFPFVVNLDHPSEATRKLEIS